MRQISTDHFTILIKHNTNTTFLKMRMHTLPLYTGQIPHVYKFLNTHLPCIYKSECFNPSKLPFKKEVQDTEIAHLFEHILLEHLRIEKTARGGKKVCFSGETRWDWNKNPYGTFHIKIDAKLVDLEVFKDAFDKSVRLFMSLLDSSNTGVGKPAIASN